jgi:hypothetical protein
MLKRADIVMMQKAGTCRFFVLSELIILEREYSFLKPVKGEAQGLGRASGSDPLPINALIS